MNIFEEFKAKWVEEQLDVNPAKDEKSIVECFKHFGLTPSIDLLNLYRTINGKGCMDNEHFRLWSLDEIQKENSSSREKNSSRIHGVLFADYLVNSWCYRINTKGEVLIDYFMEGREPELRSNSLANFFQLMAKSSDEALL